MEVLKIFFSGILGTLMMTVFSHILELLTGSKFNEAHLLNGLLDRSKFSNSNIQKNNFLGWILHFTIGICMAAMLYFYYMYISNYISLWLGIVLGFVLGIIGIAGWLIMKNCHSKPPEINWYSFFIQLVVAHVVFGVVVTWVFIRFIFKN